MIKWTRYFLAALFWIFGASSLVEGEYLYGVFGLVAMGVAIAHSEFSKRNNEKVYWIIVLASLAFVVTNLYFEGLDL